MIIKCLKITREDGIIIPWNGKETVGKYYQVIEIDMSKDDLRFRILPDDGGHPILAHAKNYKVITYILPKNWILWQYSEYSFCFGPERWVNCNLWDLSFWSSWDDSEPEALKVYEEEMKIILETDNLNDYQDPQFINR